MESTPILMDARFSKETGERGRLMDKASSVTRNPNTVVSGPTTLSTAKAKKSGSTMGRPISGTISMGRKKASGNTPGQTVPIMKETSLRTTLRGMEPTLVIVVSSPVNSVTM